MRTSLCLFTALVAAAAVTLAAPTTAAAAAPTVEIRPSALERGPDVALPHVEGRRTIVDGDRRIVLRRPVLALFGRAGPAYIAAVGTGQGGDASVVRVRGNGSRKLVVAGFPTGLTVADDGSTVAYTHQRTGRRTKVLVRSARGGPVTHQRMFPGSLSILGLSGERVLLGASGPDRTLVWDARTNRVRILIRAFGYVANTSADRFAYYTADPYLGGCSVVASLSDPDRRISRSCTERVVGFNPTGEWMATIGILSDGLGPEEVLVRRTGGRLIASYTTDYFGHVVWESNTALLMQAFRDRRTTVARCVKQRCESAEPVRRAPAPRIVG